MNLTGEIIFEHNSARESGGKYGLIWLCFEALEVYLEDCMSSSPDPKYLMNAMLMSYGRTNLLCEITVDQGLRIKFKVQNILTLKH